MSTIEYVHFDRYMKETHSWYCRASFESEIMYFCKVWKGHRLAFSKYSKQHDLIPSYLYLHQRCYEYEMSVLERKTVERGISTEDYREQLKRIQEVLL